MLTFQQILRTLSKFWEDNGCIIHQGYDLETGAGTMNPATFLRCLGPEPYRAAYIEPCRRPADGRYGTNPNRLQHYFQFQVILKPSPLNLQELYLESLKAIGVDLNKHDIRFVHDDWENPTIGAWGLGWEVWLDGMEVTQFTYFQSVGSQNLNPITGELTYGIERIGMYLQGVNSIFDLKWNDHLTYGDIYMRNEIEWSHYNFEQANTEMWFHHFNDFEKESQKLIKENLPIPAYEFVMKASHAFNILDARGVISVTERTGYISRIRELARQIAEGYIATRETAGFPLLNVFPVDPIVFPKQEKIPEKLLETASKTNYLLEIGSEELPAVFVPIGCRNLEKAVATFLKEEGIEYKKINVYGTPRRIALLIEELAMGVPELTIERKGPRIDKAYDEAGKPTQVAIGFFKSIGMEPLPYEEVKKGKDPEYIYVTIKTQKKSTASLLAQKLPSLILGLDFPKKMRWSNLEITYARPLKWIVSLMGDDILPFIVGNIAAGRESQGHRQLDPRPFTIPDAKDYLATLEKHYVLADREKRVESITKQLNTLETELQAKIIEREDVMPQVVDLVEWPMVTSASFDSSFLKVPKEVLISEMVEHQKYFPVALKDGSLKNTFVITSNTNPTDQIRAGNQKVLSSRLSDGVFLYEKGLKTPLENNNEKLKNVTYLAGFGSMYEKVQRLIGHIEVLQKELKISTNDNSHRAATLSKADLASEMVYEFPDLQGIIGRYYAHAQGENEEVALALQEQWMPLGENGSLPSTETGILLSLADKIDNLLSCFAAGLKPSSSSDPYALRRQALGMIRILIQGEYRLPLLKVLNECIRNFRPSLIKNPQVVTKEIEVFFVNRIKTVFQDFGFTADEIEASVSFGFTDIYDTFCRVKALHQFRTIAKFPPLFEVYKRARGQTTNMAAQKFSHDLLKENAEKELHSVLKLTEEQFNQALAAHNYDSAYNLISQIQPSLATLFDEVKILDDDIGVRNNRIALLQRVFELFNKLLDFSKIKE